MRETMDWSPDGKKITYMKWDLVDNVGKVYIYDIENDVETELVRGYNPQWSPDGNYLSFGQDRSVLIIKPDGTGNTTLAKSSYKGNILKTARYQYWSPDSKYLMYHIYTINYKNRGSYPTDIYVVDLDGNADCLTSSLTSTDWKAPVGWR
jgi:Tol biopolymer transport system component